jgi:predicted nucleotidyltransferase
MNAMKKNNVNRQHKRKPSQPIKQNARNGKNARGVPRSFCWWPVTDEKIREAAQKIVDAVHPEKIILFGSFAYGNPTPDSDVDLFVVMESKKCIHKRMMELSEILSPRPFPVDILTRTRAELNERLEIVFSKRL